VPDNISIPFISSDIKKINTLVRLSQMPCQVPPLVWAETFLPAAIKAVYSFIEFNPYNVVKARAGRPGIHGLGNILPKLPTVEPLLKDGLGKALWEITGKWDEIGNYFFLAELALTGAIEWTTLAYRKAGCLGTTLSAKYSNNGGTFVGSPGVWNAYGCSHKDYDPDNIGSTIGSLTIPAGYEGSISVATTWKDYFTFQPVDGVATQVISDHGNVIAETNLSILGTGTNLLTYKYVPHSQASRLNCMVMKNTSAAIRAYGSMWFALEPTV